MKFEVDGMRVFSESRRHAVKYYQAVVGREPDFVVHEDGSTSNVIGICDTSGFGIFSDDKRVSDFDMDVDGVMWLTEGVLDEARNALWEGPR